MVQNHIRNQFHTKFTSLWVSLLLCTNIIHAYPNGALPRMCKTMLPNHGEKSLDTEMPFRISVDPVLIRGAGKITVTVTSIDPKRYTLRGILFVVKKQENKGEAFGKFDPGNRNEDLKTIDCFEKPATGITHTNNNPKTKLTFQWIAPNITSAEYELHATLVRDFNSFWADYIHPKKIRVQVDAPLSTSTSMTSLKRLVFFLAAASIFSGLYL